LSLTKIDGGSAFNVIPDCITIGGTLRSTDKLLRDEMLIKIENIAQNACAINNCTLDLEIRPGYPSTINDVESARLVSEIFQKIYGKSSINKHEKPTMTSEDFSYFLEEKPGAYIWLGSGEKSEKLHSPHYDFNDDLLPIGANFWANLTEAILRE